MQRNAASLGIALLMVSATGFSGSALAKLSPDRGCRIALSAAGTKATTAALKQADGCLKRSPSPACNAVDAGRISGSLKSLAKKCGQANCTQALYGGDLSGAISSGIKSALEANGARVFAAPNVGSDKARKKCLKAIVGGRTKLLKGTVADALRKERLRPEECAPVDLGNVAANSAVASAVSAAISKACTGVNGADIGVCTDLPQCVIDAASAGARNVAKSVFTGPAECGDGKTEGVETCDDGNTDNTDACTAQCKIAACGDGAVHAGVEQCDDGNIVDTDACRADCTAARCGDGVIQTGVDECDDGNSDDADQCSNACHVNKVACGPNGLLVTVAVSTVADIRGVTTDVGFDHLAATLPGQGTDGADRVSSLIDDPETDDFVIVNDELVDIDTGIAADVNRVRVVFVKDFGATSPSAFTPGSLLRIRFDCATGATFLPADFSCTVNDATAVSGQRLDNVTCVTTSVAPAP